MNEDLFAWAASLPPCDHAETKIVDSYDGPNYHRALCRTVVCRVCELPLVRL